MERIDKVKEHVEGTDPLSVAVLEDEGDSFRVYGTETLGGNIPETLGAELKLGAENSENVGAEDLIAADPDVLFMINYDGFMTLMRQSLILQIPCICKPFCS